MRVKICGLRDTDAIAVAVEAGADAIGLVFAQSVRRVDLAEAAHLRAAIPPGVDAIAVFRLPDPDLVRAVLALGFDGIQADSTWAAPLPPRVFRLPVVCDSPWLGAAVAEIPRIERPGLAGAILVDGPLGGGAGVPGDPDRVAAVAAIRPVVLAGGLDPDNVGAAIARVRPFGVDVSSGVEYAPGMKDPGRIRAFVAAARAAEGG